MPTTKTARFGEVTYKNGDVITFVKPILGFGDLRRYIIISRPESEPFKWLQAIDDPNICFVILDPKLAYPDYSVEVSSHDIKQLGAAENENEYCLYGIVTVPKGQPEKMSINLQGPIVINTNNLKALQLVLNYPEYDIRYSLLKGKATA